MQRRSSHRTQRKQYTTDPFQSIPELRDASESPTARSQQSDAEDDVFEEAAELELASDEEATDAELTPDDEERVDDGPDADVEVVGKKPKSSAGLRGQRTQEEVDDELYTRGIPDGNNFHVAASKLARKNMYWGFSQEDHAVVQRSFDKWIHLPLLPSHEAGFNRPFLKDQRVYDQANDDDWSWYCNAEDTVLQKQIVVVSSFDKVEHLLPTTDRAFLMGPVYTPKQFTLPPQQTVPLSAGFDAARGGHIINVGARVQCLDWLPHQPGSNQYLTVATTTPRIDTNPYEAPAYTATPAFASLLQIWRVNLDDSTEPRLKALLSMNFGGLKRFQYCPYPARTYGQTPRLLGSLWSDGGLRVIVQPHISEGDDVDVYHIEQAVVESKAPDTIFTCFTWMSPRKVAAGCANGCVAVYDLRDAVQSSGNFRPRKFAAISPTFILDIASCSPTCSNLFFTTSMDGFVRLTDASQASLSSPAATVHGSRVRTILTNLVWHDHLRAAILCDDTFGVRLHLVRRIFNLFTIGRVKSTPTSTAISQCHPFLLIGTAAGDVQCLNPMTRLADNKASVWQQAWFMHEWRRGRQGDAEHIAEEGLSRFTEGYRPDKVSLSSKASSGDLMPGGIATNTVYEKQSAISALAWNSNPHVGGWAAAGMGDGLLRVEDIALSS